MSEIAIKVENLSKRYRLGQREPYRALRDVISNIVTAPFHRLARLGRRRAGAEGQNTGDEYLWALKDVTFEVKHGEVLGVIGRNGAGKSTLLKILARVTRPTAGRASIYGRVGALLEVGTGFHPELTGRENIFLNGAILGMRRAEIVRKFDEIVAFAEIERFLDTPVKRYSSGMYVRLAFAVAAHLESEILLVDEVLAVGDIAFQRKCLGKMDDVAKGGRTVMFVSHNMAAVRHLCPRSIVIAGGRIVCDAQSHEAIGFYQLQISDVTARSDSGLRFNLAREDPNARFEVRTVELLDELGNLKTQVRTGDYVRFRIGWFSSEEVDRGGVELGIHTQDRVPLIQYSTRPVSKADVVFHRGMNWIECEFPNFALAAGEYNLAVFLTRPMVEWLYVNDAFAVLHVDEYDIFGSGLPITSDRALLVLPHQWITPPIERT